MGASLPLSSSLFSSLSPLSPCFSYLVGPAAHPICLFMAAFTFVSASRPHAFTHAPPRAKMMSPHPIPRIGPARFRHLSYSRHHPRMLYRFSRPAIVTMFSSRLFLSSPEARTCGFPSVSVSVSVSILVSCLHVSGRSRSSPDRLVSSSLSYHSYIPPPVHTHHIRLRFIPFIPFIRPSVRPYLAL